MTMRGWTANELPLVDEDERLWTVAQAARLLEKRPDDVRSLIRNLEIPAVGTHRQDGPEKRGRQPRAYWAIDLIRAYDRPTKAA